MLQDDAHAKQIGGGLVMLAYSALLTLGLVLSAPWWLLRMATTERYREGLGERLGRVPARLLALVAGRRVVWVHAVSVGEVLAASRLVAELETALGEGWVVVVSTTTKTAQALVRERFGAERVFYFPLDLAFAVRAYLRVLRPEVLVLMESEIWPRMLWECRRLGAPVVVVNARVSDRSFARGLRVRWVWGRVLRGVSLWLAQSEEDTRRLVALGARAERVRLGGNLKFDVRAPKVSRVAALIKEAAAGRPIVVAGSLVERRSDKGLSEDEMVIQAWEGRVRSELGALLVLAPRHPERFGLVESVVMEFRYARASDGGNFQVEGRSTPLIAKSAMNGPPGMSPKPGERLEIFLLDTIGDLAAVYGIADVAFVGGSLVKRGGHNPLEPAQFGVPVVMGPSYENFRGIVGKMKDACGISIVGEVEAGLAKSQDRGLSTALRSGRDDKVLQGQKNADSGRDDKVLQGQKNAESGQNDRVFLVEELENELVRLLTDREAARAMGERGLQVFEAEQGATGRAVEAIVAMVQP